MHISTFWLNFGSLSPAVTLKIRSRSPKPNQLFIMSQCYIHANLVKIHPPVHEISCKQESLTLTPTPTLTQTPYESLCSNLFWVPTQFDWAKTDRAWKYIVAIFQTFSTKGIRFQMQSANLLKITHTNVDVFHGIGHFRKSAGFDIHNLS